MAEEQTGRAGSVSVRAIFWEPFPDARPEVIVSRDGDDADGRAALRLWERMARDPQSPEQLHFVDGQLSPSRWGDVEDVQRFLEAVNMELSAPVIASEWVRLSGDSTPGVDHDLSVGVIVWSADLAGDTEIVAGLDQADVERQVAAKLWGAVEDGPVEALLDERPDLDDPASVYRWLERVRGELPDVGFSLHQVNLPGDPLAALDLARLTATLDAPVPAAIPTPDRVVWVGAVFPEGRDESPDFITGAERSDVERQVADRVHYLFLNRGDDPRVAEFLDAHPYTPGLAEPSEVDEFLDSLYAASPGAAFTIEPLVITPTPGQTRLEVASVVDGNPFDARLLADVTRLGLYRQVVDALVDRLEAEPPLQAGRVFLAEWGKPQYSEVALESWIDLHQNDVGTPGVTLASMPLPDGLRRPGEVEPPPAPATVATPTVAPVTAAPERLVPTVRVSDLWSAVVESPNLFDNENPQVWVGTYGTVAQAAALLLADEIAHDRPAFLAEHPLDLDDDGSVERFLDACREERGLPIVDIRGVYDAANRGNLPPIPAGVQPPAPVQENLRVRLPEPTPVTMFTSTPPPAPARRAGDEMVVGVIAWGDDRGEITTVADDTPALVERQAARLIFDDLRTEAFDAGDLLREIGDPAGLDEQGVHAWLDRVTGVDGKPVLSLYEHVSGRRLDDVVRTASDLAVLRLVDPARAAALTPGQVTIDSQRASDWAALNEGGIPDLVIQAFPPEPRPADFADVGGATGDRFMEAVEVWMEESLATAVDIAHIDELRDRADRHEYLTDRLARHLAQHPLPTEPARDDYLLLHPWFEGEYEDQAYRWDHTQWQQDFRQAALARDAYLTKLVGSTGVKVPGTAAPVQEESLGFASVGSAVARRVSALFELIKPAPGGGASLAEQGLSATDRIGLEQTIRTGIATIRARDERGEVYAGPAALAHHELQPGVYEASLPDYSEDMMLVVGRSPVNGRTGISAAWPITQATAQTLADVGTMRAQAIGQASRPDVTVSIGFKVTPGGTTSSGYPFLAPPPQPTPPAMSL